MNEQDRNVEADAAEAKVRAAECLAKKLEVGAGEGAHHRTRRKGYSRTRDPSSRLREQPARRTR